MSTLYVKVTDACNMKCPFCYVKQSDSVVSMEAVRDTLNEHPEISRVVLHGGEPLLHIIRCQEIADECETRNIPVSITSNLTIRLGHEHKEFLKRLSKQKKISVATSFSYDRFEEYWEQEARFIENTKWLNANGIPFTLLVTLSPMHMIHQSPYETRQAIETINPANVTFERVCSKDTATAVYSQTFDDYLSAMFVEIPKEKNNLRKWMIDAIKKNVPVFNPHCGSLTLETDGRLTGCPNLCSKEYLPQRRRECLECGLFKWCQGDCPSFREVCSFPQNTFKKVMEGEI